MKKIFVLLFSFCLLFILISSLSFKSENQRLVEYLEKNWQTPEDYIIDKFKDHDYVFLGEYHRIKHDVELVNRLIPRLYEAGIYNLCIEFGNIDDQPLVDSLLNMEQFDRQLAQKIIFNSGPFWGYKEYIDLYETAWNVNKQNYDKKKFRIVNFGPPYYPCPAKWEGEKEPDEYMADAVIKEVINKGEKALLYSGMHHAFTRYHQPRWDFENDTLVHFVTNRMGNIIYNKVKGRAFNIFLHSPWGSDKGFNEDSVLPVDGVIDSVMHVFGDKPVGFDVAGSPFGKLPAENSYYRLGYPAFTLDMFCDGYIFQTELKNYEFVTSERDFYTDENILLLKEWVKCQGFYNNYYVGLTAEKANRDELSQEDIRKHFGYLMK